MEIYVVTSTTVEFSDLKLADMVHNALFPGRAFSSRDSALEAVAGEISELIEELELEDTSPETENTDDEGVTTMYHDVIGMMWRVSKVQVED